ncbi:hypothetical protein [Burkholderia ubonensis]|uniref:hypothetical protein n=1 Tax=Burkholderia ubonensis TaxID=101571 RepID=UPI000AC9329A|nr:hypothetical protein [Burkholderia ubonensis]
MGARKPVRCAYERNHAAIQRWLNEDYPQVAKEAKREEATIYWGDEIVCAATITKRGELSFMIRGHVHERNVHRIPEAVAQAGYPEELPDRR